MAKDTPQRLLDAALDVFAEQGYQAATIQEIVKRAGTNIAAINYHFRDKANFYAEVVLYGCEKQGVGQPDFLQAENDPEQQLYLFIQWFLQRGLRLGAASLMDQIHMQELANPSPVLDKVVEKLIRPVHLQLRQIICALLPDNSEEQVIRFHCFSVIGQCNLYKIGKPVMTRLYPDMQLDEQCMQQLAKHIYLVSLAGIQAQNQQYGDNHV
jgi:AcrR family transcriptional regulator